MSEVVTGEAVVVEVRVAQLPSRAVAYIIDWVLQWAVLIVAYILLSNASIVTDTALARGLVILFTVLVIVGYPVIFETVSRGRSLGKLALGLRVVGDDGGPERFRQALFRGLAGFVEFWIFFGAPALITSLVNEKGKRLGDIFAGTMVIGERAPRQAPPPAMPPQLAAWASSLELSQLSDDLANTARQYLSRWHQLAPVTRHEMGVRIAEQVSARVAPPPPPGVPPHAYLAAVLAERRRREEIRLAQARRPAMPYGTAPQNYGAAPAYGTAPANGGAPQHGGAPQWQPRPAPEARPAGSEPAGPTPGGFLPPV
ncbi:RDD family protein [Planotetraspora sp. GP83]|uniref:RDD family protein n=1 Tax=Planotetraspora sp. GP83 TaxID=3156264 RepID=UPI003516C955